MYRHVYSFITSFRSINDLGLRSTNDLSLRSINDLIQKRVHAQSKNVYGSRTMFNFSKNICYSKFVSCRVAIIAAVANKNKAICFSFFVLHKKICKIISLLKVEKFEDALKKMHQYGNIFFTRNLMKKQNVKFVEQLQSQKIKYIFTY